MHLYRAHIHNDVLKGALQMYVCMLENLAVEQLHTLVEISYVHYLQGRLQARPTLQTMKAVTRHCLQTQCSNRKLFTSLSFHSRSGPKSNHSTLGTFPRLSTQFRRTRVSTTEFVPTAEPRYRNTCEMVRLRADANSQPSGSESHAYPLRHRGSTCTYDKNRCLISDIFVFAADSGTSTPDTNISLLYTVMLSGG